MIDLHCHVLPGVDDGAQTTAEALELARASLAAGVSTIVATPHVSARYPNDGAAIARLAAELNARLAAEQVAVEICAGAEIEAAKVPEIERGRLSQLRLGRGDWILLEPPFSPFAPTLEAVATELRRQGCGVVLAHPERCPAFHRDPAMLESLVRGGALTSVTAGSLVGRFGKDVRSFALDLADAHMLHNVASDAHDLDRRPPGIAAELERAGLASLTAWLTQEVPAAILAGAAIPRRPAQARTAAGGGWKALWQRRDRARAPISRWPGRLAEVGEPGDPPGGGRGKEEGPR